MSSQVAEPFTSVDIPAEALQDFESFTEGLPADQRQQDLPVAPEIAAGLPQAPGLPEQEVLVPVAEHPPQDNGPSSDSDVELLSIKFAPKKRARAAQVKIEPSSSTGPSPSHCLLPTLSPKAEQVKREASASRELRCNQGHTMVLREPASQRPFWKREGGQLVPMVEFEKVVCDRCSKITEAAAYRCDVCNFDCCQHCAAR